MVAEGSIDGVKARTYNPDPILPLESAVAGLADLEPRAHFGKAVLWMHGLAH
jgi:hypothetical protein